MTIYSNGGYGNNTRSLEIGKKGKVLMERAPKEMNLVKAYHISFPSTPNEEKDGTFKERRLSLTFVSDIVFALAIMLY